MVTLFTIGGGAIWHILHGEEADGELMAVCGKAGYGGRQKRVPQAQVRQTANCGNCLRGTWPDMIPDEP